MRAEYPKYLKNYLLIIQIYDLQLQNQPVIIKRDTIF